MGDMTCERYATRLAAFVTVGGVLALHSAGEAMQAEHIYGQVFND